MKLFLISCIFVIYLTSIGGQYVQQLGESHNSYYSNSLPSSDQSSRPASASIIIPIGFTRHHPIEYVDYKPEGPEDREPPTIQVEGRNTPLNIIFNPRLNHLSVADSDDHTFRDSNDEKYTYSEEEPIITYHEVNTPLIHEELTHQYPCGYEDNQSNNQNKNGDQNWQITHQESRPLC